MISNPVGEQKIACIDSSRLDTRQKTYLTTMSEAFTVCQGEPNFYTLII